MMKKTEDCVNIEEIRSGIDEIDYEIIKLLSKRAEFVHCAARFKTSEQSVKSESRVKSMIETRKKWAINFGLSPNFIEKLYHGIVEYFISDELKKWSEHSINNEE